MISQFRTRLCFAAAFGCLIMVSNVSEAAGPYYEGSVPARMTRKLLRGVQNIAFGFIEVPLAIGEETQLLDPFTGTFTGLVKGTGRWAGRVVVGAYETVTFPIPLPRGYKKIIEPEFVMMEDTRSWRKRLESADLID